MKGNHSFRTESGVSAGALLLGVALPQVAIVPAVALAYLALSTVRSEDTARFAGSLYALVGVALVVAFVVFLVGIPRSKVFGPSEPLATLVVASVRAPGVGS